MPDSTLLAAGFVADLPEQGTSFPSSGGNSGDPRVQALYWRCLVVLFASARFTNPAQRLALFTNAAPPRVDGVEIAAVLARYGVETHHVPLTARLAQGTTGKFGNVLYFHDILAHLAAHEAADLRLALIDADVVVTGPLQPLFALLDHHPFAGYVARNPVPEFATAGLTMRELGTIAGQLGASDAPLAAHYGGELLVTSIAAWRQHGPLFGTMVANAMDRTGPARAIITEEHVYSVAFAVLRGQVATANHLIKRMWTSPRFNTIAPGDEHLLLWHLPAEKRYGLQDLFAWLRRHGFPEQVDGDTFRRMAMKFCGVPHKRLGKIMFDGVRQLAAKAGLRP
jgi:hypothetical protein